jgi:hypothetical protein
MTKAAYDTCLSCFQECGDTCDANATCPETYDCRN